MKTAAQITNLYRSEFVPVSCNYPLSLRLSSLCNVVGSLIRSFFVFVVATITKNQSIDRYNVLATVPEDRRDRAPLSYQNDDWLLSK